jgi:hypothetical protein
MARWLAPQSWVNGAVDLGLIEKQLAKWEMAGRPHGPPSQPRPNGAAPRRTTAADALRIAAELEEQGR